jgi:hypothetical protein
LVPAAIPPRSHFILYRNDERTGDADQAKNGSGILWRIDAPTLGMQRQSSQEQKSKIESTPTTVIQRAPSPELEH